MLNLYLIRHGESVNNKYNYGVVGGISKDTDLTDEGEIQAQLLGQRLKEEIKFDKILSSTAIRASKTCDIACGIAGYNLDNIIRSDRLFEVDRGEMVGMKRKYVKAFFTSPYVDSWTYQPKNGESNVMAAQRIYDFLREHLEDFNYEGSVAVFGHGHLFRVFLKTIMEHHEYADWNNAYKISIDNTAITHLQYDNEWCVKKLNDTLHLRR